jgi:cytochrome c
MKTLAILAVISFSFLFYSCGAKDTQLKITKEQPKKTFYIVPGEDDPIDSALVKRGEVLIAYSDCYQCHKEESKAKGPSFSDIARRYPIQEAYIDMLARKVISGGSGVWGYPVMSSHPKLPADEAKAMVTYILSLEEK